MSHKKEVEVTVEQGNLIYQLASNMEYKVFPEKIGDTPINPADRSKAVEEIHLLQLEMKSWSPLSLKKERWMLFGPIDCWGEIKDDSGKVRGHRCEDPDATVTMKLDDDQESGLVWCLTLMTAYGSPFEHKAAVKNDVLYPLAKKIDRISAIKEIGGFGKGTPRRWKKDSEPEKKEESSKS